VAYGWKTIETRLHDRFRHLVGQRIGIHAAKRWDPSAQRAARDYLTSEQLNDPGWYFPNPRRGRLIATAMVAESRRLRDADSAAALIDCGCTLRYGLLLTQTRPIAKPIPMVGRQGVWTIDVPVEQLDLREAV
jgi:hypothetical protein